MNCVIYPIFSNFELQRAFFMYQQITNSKNKIDFIIYTIDIYQKIVERYFFNYSDVYIEYRNSYSTNTFLDTFQFVNIINYNKILFISPNIIIEDIDTLFSIDIEPNKIYSIQKNIPLTNIFDISEIEQYKEQNVISMDCLLFVNSIDVKNLFQEIKNEINSSTEKCFTLELLEKITNYKSITKQMNNTDFLTHLISYVPEETNFNKRKEDIKFKIINDIIDNAKVYITKKLLPIIKNTGELLEGNLFTSHLSYEYTNMYLEKVINFINILKTKRNINYVMEIGFNAGFSTLLMLMSNPNIHITCVDLGEHKYTIPCFNQIRKDFGNRLHLIIGDSTETVPKLHKKFDLIHIDGGHTLDIAT